MRSYKLEYPVLAEAEYQVGPFVAAPFKQAAAALFAQLPLAKAFLCGMIHDSQLLGTRLEGDAFVLRFDDYLTCDFSGQLLTALGRDEELKREKEAWYPVELRFVEVGNLVCSRIDEGGSLEQVELAGVRADELLADCVRSFDAENVAMALELDGEASWLIEVSARRLVIVEDLAGCFVSKFGERWLRLFHVFWQNRLIRRGLEWREVQRLVEQVRTEGGA